MLNLMREAIPDRLKKNKKWVGFKVNDFGKKIPIDPKPTGSDSIASIADPSTWGSFEQAAKAVEVGLCVAVGYALTKEDGLIFIDIDNHSEGVSTQEEKDTLQKQYDAMCRAVADFHTYQEKSLSGNGVHLLAEGTLDNTLKQGISLNAPLEIYTEKRFVIVTGHRINDFDIDSSDRTIGGIRNLHRNYFEGLTSDHFTTDKALIPPIETPIYEDKDVLRVAHKDKKFSLLWEGCWEQVLDKEGKQTYTSQHYADLALVRKLIFYTGNCPVQAERLFRQSPCYLAYGQNGKWEKFDSDIKKDISTTSTTCTAVYTPSSNPPADRQVANSTSEPAKPSIWKPDYNGILAILVGDKDSIPFHSSALIIALTDYVIKYKDYENITYIPYLFREDRNIVGATNIVRRRWGNNFKYSLKFGSYFIWNGVKFQDFADNEILLHPITEALALVEHSVFLYAMTDVLQANDTNEYKAGRNDREKGLTEKEYLEEKCVKLFAESKKYVDCRLASEVLKKYKGLSVGDDIAGYYDSPYINMQNGVLDLSTRVLLPHDPKYNLHKITDCEYTPDADCPEFRAMIARLIPAEDERKELQKAFGLCLAKEQLPAKKVLMLLVGEKDTGKTTLLNTILGVLGEYGTSVDNSVLMQNRQEKNRGPEMYDFRETLMITTSEANENDKLDTGRVKALTGETVQSVRNNFATRVDKFRMIGLIFIDSNFRPYIPPKDEAAWGRLRLFPFLYPVKQKDPDLKNKLVAEKAGIFNWLLAGLDMVLEEKEIFETPEMREYKQQYKIDMDSTSQFLTDCTIKTEEESDRVLTSILFSTYKNWCKDNGFKESIRNKFYEDIIKTYPKKKSGSEYFVYIRLTPLGSLYSRMEEKTSQQFAKEKRALLDNPEADADLPYSVLRQTYYSKTKEWFAKNIEFGADTKMLMDSYYLYSSWCIDNRLMPLKAQDCNAKVCFIHKNLSAPYPPPELLEKAKSIWSDS